MKRSKKMAIIAMCTAVSLVMLLFSGCGHRHVWPESWEYNILNHWRECEVCGEIEKAEHTYKAGVCTVCGYECEHSGSWSFNSSEHWRTCVLCGEEMSGSHKYEDGVCSICGYECEHNSSGSWSYSSTEHWRTCNICGKEMRGGHVYGNNNGVCTICGYICTHKYSSDWQSDATNHWHQCAICGIHSDESAHRWKDGVCTVCSYVCLHDQAAWGYDGYHHWSTCAICGEEEADFGVHEFVDGICTICAAPEPEPIDISNFVEGVDYFAINWAVSSHTPYETADSSWLNQILNAVDGAKFIEGDYTGDEMWALGGRNFQVIELQLYNRSEDINAYMWIYPDGSIELGYPHHAVDEKDYLALAGAVDFNEIKGILLEMQREHNEQYHPSWVN